PKISSVPSSDLAPASQSNELRLFSSGTTARRRFDDNATNGATSPSIITAHCEGSLVSNSAHSIRISPPEIPAPGLIPSIAPPLFIRSQPNARSLMFADCLIQQ